DKGGSADSSMSTPKGSAAEGTAEEPDEKSQGSEEAPEVVPEWPDGVPMICGTCGHGDSKETRRLKAEAKSWKHQLTHLPKNPYCWSCVLGKLTKKRARKKGDLEDGAVEFGEKVTCDDIISAGVSEGLGGETVGKHFLDLGTGWHDLYPTASKSKVDAIQSMQHFAGEKDEIKSFYTDNAKEITEAAAILGWRNPTSTPYRSHTNGKIERENRTTEEATRTNLIQAGLPNKWWPLAGKHACFMRNVCSEDADGKTAWEKRHK
ncbi:MAG: hypothetical protein VXZ35_12845, partial [Pseudomonadota bacterium]|nr:hypothetical protein [Pseudomonadota bacterium]